MSQKRVATIQDDHGDVWTGKEEAKGTGLSDLLLGLVCPPTLLSLGDDGGNTTVTVNGESHSGKRV